MTVKEFVEIKIRECIEKEKAETLNQIWFNVAYVQFKYHLDMTLEEHNNSTVEEYEIKMYEELKKLENNLCFMIEKNIYLLTKVDVLKIDPNQERCVKAEFKFKCVWEGVNG